MRPYLLVKIKPGCDSRAINVKGNIFFNIAFDTVPNQK
jgi:hypothetical protein